MNAMQRAERVERIKANINPGYVPRIAIPRTVRPIKPRTLSPFNPSRAGERWPRNGWKGVIYRVCMERRIKIADLMVGDKHKPVVACRWEIIRQLYERGHSACRIAGWLGMNHTSVGYAVERLSGKQPHELKRHAYRYAGKACDTAISRVANESMKGEASCGDREFDLAIVPAAANEATPVSGASPSQHER